MTTVGLKGDEKQLSVSRGGTGVRKEKESEREKAHVHVKQKQKKRNKIEDRRALTASKKVEERDEEEFHLISSVRTEDTPKRKATKEKKSIARI